MRDVVVAAVLGVCVWSAAGAETSTEVGRMSPSLESLFLLAEIPGIETVSPESLRSTLAAIQGEQGLAEFARDASQRPAGDPCPD